MPSPKNIDATCKHCLSAFKAGKRNGRLQVYCSLNCKIESMKTGAMGQCAKCGVDMYIPAARGRESKMKERFCSLKCKNAYCVGTKSQVWKGGEHLRTDGQIYVTHKRAGFSSTNVGRHRVIAEKAIGRHLKRGEYVIRVNGDKDDYRESNLFICGSVSEYSRRRHGSLPWPEKSNLDTYK